MSEYKKKLFYLVSGSLLVLMFLPISNIWLKGLPSTVSYSSIKSLFMADVANGALNYVLYKVGVSGQYSQLIVGKDGWLFLGDKNNQGMSRGRDIYSASEQDIGRWVSSMHSREKWLSDRNIPMLFAIAPNKHTIYPEYLPDWIEIPVRNSTDRLYEAAKASGLNIIDLRQGLSAKKDKLPYLYNKANSHWTALGAFVSYQQIMDGVSLLVPALERIEDKDVEFNLVAMEACCLPHILKINHFLPEDTDFGYELKFIDVSDKVCIGSPGEDCVVGVNRELHTNKKPLRVLNDDAINDISVLMLRDSFGDAMSPYISATFSRSFQISYNQVKKDEMVKALVKREMPDLVLYLVVERALFGKAFYASGELY